MKKIIYFAVALFLAAACSSSPKASINVQYVGAPDSTQIVLSKLDINVIVPVDTIYVIKQNANFKIECKEGCPDFYYLKSNDRELASIIVFPDDKITVKVDGSSTPIFTGSDESVKLQGVEKQFADALNVFETYSKELEQALLGGDEKSATELRKKLGALYVKQKQGNIAYIFKNAGSMTVIPVIYQRFNQDLPIFGDNKDFLILQQVYDTLHVKYPNSPYLASLADNIANRQNAINFENKIAEAKEMSYPDISLRDINSKARNLSENDGKVIMLLFWTATNAEQKMFNSELIDFYYKYNDKGFEIYQVSLDVDKTVWASTITEQRLPWINVCDPLGQSSQYVALYGLQKVPSMFIIDKTGNIVEKDIFDMDKLNKKISSLL